MNDITKFAILAKNLNHPWGPDGFCTLCHKTHRTDFRANDLCPQLMKDKVLAEDLKEGDTILIAEGPRKIIQVDKEPAPCVVLTLWFKGYSNPFFCGCKSIQTLAKNTP